MKKLLLLFFLPLNIYCQNTIGLPDVVNYTKQHYGGGLQNWDVQQDKNGIMYFANNEGLLTFDGKYWHVYPLPNKTIVRSVFIAKNGYIYVGGQDELGYFTPNTNGILTYHSLVYLLPANCKSLADIWDIVAYDNDLFFRANNKILQLTNQSFTNYDAPSEWSYLGVCNNKLYAHDYKAGILEFTNKIWKTITVPQTFAINGPVTGIFSIGIDSTFITTIKDGIYILTKNALTRFKSNANQNFITNRIYAATPIDEHWFAIATSNNGIYIVDVQGNVVQSFSANEGLQNNNVLSIYLDAQHNLWLGLDNGIDVIAYNSAIKKIKPLGLEGSGYAAIINNNQLYTGTPNGLYCVPLQPMADLSFSKGNFMPIANANGQVWSLTEINNQLLMGHHEGAFAIQNNVAALINTKKGYWNFIASSNIYPTPQLIAGNYNGLQYFNYVNQQFTASTTVPGFDESSRFVVIDKENNTWVSHPYHGIYCITPNANGSFTSHTYTQKDGLPSTLANYVYKIKNEVVIATEKGIYSFNTTKKIFEPNETYTNILGTQSIRYLKEDTEGNVWFIHEKMLGIIDFTNKQPSIMYIPELSGKLLSGFECVYPYNQYNIFLGSEKGFFHINYAKYKKTLPNLQLQIRSVHIINEKDSLLFGGYYTPVNETQSQINDNNIHYRFTTVRFQYSAAVFGTQGNVEYSYRLKGLNEYWSEWTDRTEKEFTNLPTGNFIFEVKVRNNLGNESAVVSYSFTILPPWYKTIWATIGYLVLFGVGMFSLFKWQQQKFNTQQLKYEAEQKQLQYIHELELSKTESELITVNNAKLEADLNFKNSELASAAMHLVKKGELLAKLKAELTHIMKGLDNTTAVAEIKKMIKALSEDDNMDKEWDNFSKHFDKVHSDFLIALKELHPTITPNELKLSAYLRMNLSTKEIAQLMNISVRGVEISRYRLRKKLSIPTEDSLFDYLITIQAK